ncbi:Uncharacterised protein [Vibrio cholerae]|uniref:Uncharacterized protein n=1 Tax=Vibrio cholerae TaxID=666 RepID=A0A655NZ28_VIBCL|nr:Uncharacterised protein [Vibrio cholerae]CRZ99077.1 Uncharacterised protein [Vibrio cholerae]CSA15697.1 Uncharacterised protein [Vibrio cholerae]CSB31036.1 Uncharacterised protein [Vibrio cholerae]CSB53610.1 Uncharacterised protein [Vibrio cholerae]
MQVSNAGLNFFIFYLNIERVVKVFREALLFFIHRDGSGQNGIFNIRKSAGGKNAWHCIILDSIVID